MVHAMRVQVDPLAVAPGVEAEFGVEALRHLEIGYGEDEAVQRMHGGHAVPTWRCADAAFMALLAS